jgi:hypothetical protein
MTRAALVANPGKKLRGGNRQTRRRHHVTPLLRQKKATALVGGIGGLALLPDHL